MAALAVLSFAVATYLIYAKFTGVAAGLLLGESRVAKSRVGGRGYLWGNGVGFKAGSTAKKHYKIQG